MRKGNIINSLNIFKYSYIFVIVLLVFCSLYIYIVKKQNIYSASDYKKFIDYAINLVHQTAIVKSASGQKILLYHNKNSNIVSIDFALKIDSLDGNKNTEDTIYLVSNIIINSAQVKQYMYDYSMQMSITVNKGFIIINITSANYYIKEVVQVLKLILFNITFTNEDLLIAKQNLQQEYNRQDKDAKRIFQEQVFPQIFPNNNYYRAIKDNNLSIDNIKLKDIYFCYDKYFNLDNVIVSVSGRINQNTIIFYMNRIFVDKPQDIVEISYGEEEHADIKSLAEVQEIKIRRANSDNAIVYAIIPFIGADKHITYAHIISQYLLEITNQYFLNNNFDVEQEIYALDIYFYNDNFSKFWVIAVETSKNQLIAVENYLKNTFPTYKFSYLGIAQARNMIVRNNLKNFMNNVSIARYLTMLQIEKNNIRSYLWSYDKYYFLDEEELKMLWDDNFTNSSMRIIRGIS